MSKFEGELAPALNRILKAGNLKSAEDRAILLNFIGFIAIRNPQQRETFRKFNEDVMNRGTPAQRRKNAGRAKCSG